MAELSADTQAIIERLKDEGTLIRNRGTNSIRSVKIQLDRFEGVFNTISSNIIQQTKMLQTQVGIAQEAVEAQKTKEQFDELDQEKNEKIKASDDGSESRKKSDDNFEKIGNKLESIFSLKNLALAGAGLFVGYNLLKGFIDERTDGGFTRMEESIRDTDFSGLSTMVNALTSINWQGFADIMNKLITSIQNFDNWLVALPGILLGGPLIRQGIRGAVEGALDSRRGNKGPTRENAGRGRGLGALRATVLGAVTALAWAYGDDVEAYLKEQMGMDPDFAKLSVDVAKYGLSAAAGAATLAAMFGMTIGAPGLILAAAVGVGLVLGKGIYDWFQDRKKAAAAAARAQLDAMTGNEGLDFATGGPTGGVNLTEVPGSGALNGGEVAVLGGRAVARGELDEIVTRYRANLDNAVMREGMLEWIQRMVDILDNEGSRPEERQYAREQLQRLRGMFPAIQADLDALSGVMANDARSYFRDNILDLYNSYAEDFSFRKGTQGFMDFGAGQFAVLHGREAVVPFNTAAGQFLDRYFTDNWEPRVANQSRIETASSGAGNGGGTVVINAPTTVSPNVTNVEGAKSVNQLSVRTGGGGMGSGSANPYGLPGLAN